MDGIDLALDYDLHLLPLDRDWYMLTGTSPQYKWMKEIIAHLRKNTDALIAAGGPHAYACPEDLDVDTIHKPFDITDLLPDRSIFGDGYARTIFGHQAVHVVTLQGCPYSCNYCDKTTVGRKVRFRTVEHVAMELIDLKSKGCDSFVIYDDIFNLDKNRLREFCKLFAKLNITWRCWSRADTLTVQGLQMMKDSGLSSITIGIESGSDVVLKRINKDCTARDNKKALEICRKLEVPVRCSLMFGNPGDNLESVNDTLKMIRDYRPNEWNLAVLKPIPGSEFWNNPEQHGLGFDKQGIIEREYQDLHRFDGDGFGNVLCEVDGQSIEELEKLLAFFVKELKTIPREDIQT